MPNPVDLLFCHFSRGINFKCAHEFRKGSGVVSRCANLLPQVNVIFRSLEARLVVRRTVLQILWVFLIGLLVELVCGGYIVFCLSRLALFVERCGRLRHGLEPGNTEHQGKTAHNG